MQLRISAIIVVYLCSSALLLTPAIVFAVQEPEQQGPSTDRQSDQIQDPESLVARSATADLDRQIEELEKLAPTMKGLEQAGLQKELERLKNDRHRVELEARVMFARTQGDESRALELEKVIDELTKPREPETPPEGQHRKRKPPAEKPAAENGARS